MKENNSTARYDFPMFAPTGWICPKCGRVNAPTMMTCPCYRESRTGVTWSTATETKTEEKTGGTK